jgi:hypothetical protein
MIIIKLNEINIEYVLTAVASYIINNSVNKIFFDYNGELLESPRNQPPLIYNEIEYNITVNSITIYNNYGPYDVPIIKIPQIIKRIMELQSKITTEIKYPCLIESCNNTISYNISNNYTPNRRSKKNETVIFYSHITENMINDHSRLLQQSEIEYQHCINYRSVVIDTCNMFNVGDLHEINSSTIPLQYFTKYKNIVSDKRIKFGNRYNISIAHILYANTKKNSTSPINIVMSNIYEEKWDSITPKNIPADCKKTTEIIEYIKEHSLGCVIKSDPVSESKDQCIMCKTVLCDFIYVLELDGVHHWCICSCCMSEQILKCFDTFNVSLLKVKHPISIPDAINTLDVDDNIKKLFVELCTEKKWTTDCYTHIANLYDYLLGNNKTTKQVYIF